MAAPFQEILDFWFGAPFDETAIPKEKREMWFQKGKDYDEIIKEKFLPLHDKVAKGELDRWARRSKGCLALILLMDQFSRHIYRQQAQAFAMDARAVEHVKTAIATEIDRELSLVERSFLYMPLMHSEDIKTQQLSVKMFATLAQEAPATGKKTYQTTLSFAQSHQYVIDRFGRFPELNDLLSRESTALEKSFLATGKYQFL
jgi:uncharacterized protein (DUF924 family)